MQQVEEEEIQKKALAKLAREKEERIKLI